MNKGLRTFKVALDRRAYRPRRIFFSSFVIRQLAFLLLAMPAACNTPNQKWGGPLSKAHSDPAEPPPESNIVRVNKFFSQNPWLSFTNDGSGKVDGVSFTVYLEGPRGPRGVFGTGTLVVTMYRVDRDPLGRESVTPAHEWVLPPDQAYPWRCKRPSAMGWGYGLRLQWPETVKVAGKQVAMIVKYVREDGREISSSRQVLKVPVSASLAVPTAVTGNPVAKPAVPRAQ